MPAGLCFLRYPSPKKIQINEPVSRGPLLKLSQYTVATMNPAIPYSEIETLFLDVGNTLISMDYAWVAEELAAHGVHCEVSALHRAEAAARPLVSAGLERRSTETEDAFRFYLETVLHCLPGGSDMDPSQLSKISRELAPVLRPAGQAERLWSSVIPGVPDALISLGKAGVQLAAVSNSDGTVEEVLVRQSCGPIFQRYMIHRSSDSRNPTRVSSFMRLRI